MVKKKDLALSKTQIVYYEEKIKKKDNIISNLKLELAELKKFKKENEKYAEMVQVG